MLSNLSRPINVVLTKSKFLPKVIQALEKTQQKTKGASNS